MARHFLTALLGTAAVSAGIPASAEGIFMNSLFDTYEFNEVNPDFWLHQGQRANTIVESGAYLGVAAAEGLHYALELDEKGRNARGWFALLGGMVQYQYQQANAIYFGHGYAHFQARDYFGYEQHSFVEKADSSEQVDGTALYFNLLGGSNPATAFNVGSSNGRDPEKEILVKSAGLSWQMNYSEAWVRRGLRARGNAFFSFPGYLHNRAKTLTYALGDEDGGELSGDVEYISDEFQENLGIHTSIDDIRLYSGLALLASPTTWKVAQGFGDYIETGDLKMEHPFFEAGGLRYTWDVPAYLNAENMTLAPTAYVDLDGYILAPVSRLPLSEKGATILRSPSARTGSTSSSRPSTPSRLMAATRR